MSVWWQPVQTPSTSCLPGPSGSAGVGPAPARRAERAGTARRSLRTGSRPSHVSPPNRIVAIRYPMVVPAGPLVKQKARQFRRRITQIRSADARFDNLVGGINSLEALAYRLACQNAQNGQTFRTLPVIGARS